MINTQWEYVCTEDLLCSVADLCTLCVLSYLNLSSLEKLCIIIIPILEVRKPSQRGKYFLRITQHGFTELGFTSWHVKPQNMEPGPHEGMRLILILVNKSKDIEDFSRLGQVLQQILGAGNKHFSVGEQGGSDLGWSRSFILMSDT